MKARLIQTADGERRILCENGEVISASLSNLTEFLINFRNFGSCSSDLGHWNTEINEMSVFPGTTEAFITDDCRLVILAPDAFMPLMKPKEELFEGSEEKFVTTREFAELHNKSVEMVKVYCRKGAIHGAFKLGRDWMIPVDAPLPPKGPVGRPKIIR